jgi:hypothetical protein
MSTPLPNDSVGLGYYAVAFFDLLGQQDELRSLTELPDPNNKQAMDKARSTLRRTYGAVKEMREHFSNVFNAYARSRTGMDLTGLNESQRAEFISWTNDPIQFRGFSDSLVVYMPLRIHEAAKLPARGLFGILSAAAITFTTSLAAGHPIRGGIDIGIGVEHGDREIYGPVLSRAYTLESRVADYPRIVVGEEMMRYLHLLVSQAQESNLAKVSAKTAQSCLDCMATDNDGHVFVDHMGKYFHDQIAGKVDGAVIQMAYDKVVEFGETHKKAKNSKLAFRYALLRDYFEDRLPIWQDVLSKPGANAI